MKKFQITVSEEQRELLQEILCAVVEGNKERAVSLAEEGRHYMHVCMDMLEEAANVDAIWTAVNLATSIEVEDE